MPRGTPPDTPVRLLASSSDDETASEEATVSEDSGAESEHEMLLVPRGNAAKTAKTSRDPADGSPTQSIMPLRTRSRSASPVRASPRRSDASSQPKTPAGRKKKKVEPPASLGLAENVSVFCRFRPISDLERQRGLEERPQAGGKPAVELDPDMQTVHVRNLEREESTMAADNSAQSFKFRAVFPPQSTNPEVYANIGRTLVDSVMSGFNAAVIAYGQTGSGKTHTMIGSDCGSGDGSSAGAGAATAAEQDCSGCGNGQQGAGLIPRLTADLFRRIEEEQRGGRGGAGAATVAEGAGRARRRAYTVRAAFLEIYQEKVRDLLNSERSGEDLGLREEHATTSGARGERRRKQPATAAAAASSTTASSSSASRAATQSGGGGRPGGVWVEGATEIVVASWADVAAVLTLGNTARAQASTRSNQRSSRSHAIFALTIHAYDLESGVTTTSQLYAVDLAGSESVRHVEVGALQMEEAKKINTSLLALGQVVFALTQGKRKGLHVPYRNSKLTRLLSNTFGGNSRTVLIITVSPANLRGSYRETVSSLRFGDRSQRVKNRPEIIASRSGQHQKILWRAYTMPSDNSPNSEYGDDDVAAAWF
eukprot:COSAG05_NODE_363_length_10783_cov_2433.390865_6_plen_596_part_00